MAGSLANNTREMKSHAKDSALMAIMMAAVTTGVPSGADNSDETKCTLCYLKRCRCSSAYGLAIVCNAANITLSSISKSYPLVVW
jgi:hypothetical protein